MKDVRTCSDLELSFSLPT